MQPKRTISRWSQPARLLLAGLLVIWFFYSAALSASPSLHRLVHDEAGQASHQCAITLLQQQQLLASDPGLVIVSREWSCAETGFSPQQLHFSTVDLRLSQSRAPPA